MHRTEAIIDIVIQLELIRRSIKLAKFFSDEIDESKELAIRRSRVSHFVSHKNYI